MTQKRDGPQVPDRAQRAGGNAAPEEVAKLAEVTKSVWASELLLDGRVGVPDALNVSRRSRRSLTRALS